MGAVHAFYLHQVPIIALSFGAVLRIQQFAFRRSLWLDETTLAVNIVGRSYADLLQALDLQQSAPVGFLWVQRFLITVLGNNEYALRLFPLLCGLGSLFLFYRLARRILSAKVVPVAMILFALSPLLAYYSNEAKQYSGDVLAALLVMNVGHALMRSTRISARSAAGFGLLGVVLVWFSSPVVLVLGGVGSTVLLAHILHRRWGNVARLGAACVAWGASFAFAWSITRRSVDAYPAFFEYWAAGLPPEGGSLGDLAGWLGERALDVMASPLGLSFTGLGLALCGVGTASFVRRGRAFDLLLLVSPLPFLLAASFLRQYPIRWRLVLFLAPIFLLLLASSIDWEVRRRPRIALTLFLVPLAIVAVAPVRTAAGTFLQPPDANMARPVFQHVARNWRSGDHLYVHEVAGAAYLYYAAVVDLKAAGYIVRRNDVPCDPAKTLSALKRATRVWLVFAYNLSTRPINERAIVRSFIEVVARPVSGFVATESAAYLYDPHAPPPNPIRRSVGDSSTPCVGVRAL
jgi:4-amino-4-deoxy-L-arabinose transferase-like glycosyltransferase